MGPIWLVALLGLSGWAVVGAKGMKWKLLNLLIIIAFIGAGLGIGYLAGVWGKNMALGGEISVPLMVVLGAVGALGCVRRNARREKESPSSPTTV